MTNINVFFNIKIILYIYNKISIEFLSLLHKYIYIYLNIYTEINKEKNISIYNINMMILTIVNKIKQNNHSKN